MRTRVHHVAGLERVPERVRWKSLFGGGSGPTPAAPTPTPPPPLPDPEDPATLAFARRKAALATAGGRQSTNLTTASQTIGGGGMGSKLGA